MQRGSSIFYATGVWNNEYPLNYRDYRLLDTLAENDRVKLVPYRDELFDFHLEIRRELYPMLTKVITSNENMKVDYRRMVIEESEELKVLVFTADINQLIGEVVAQRPCNGTIELGWDILPQHQRQGYATSAVTLFMELLSRREDCRGFVATVEASYLLTDEVVEEARIFNVNPEELLTHGLVFSIPQP